MQGWGIPGFFDIKIVRFSPGRNSEFKDLAIPGFCDSWMPGLWFSKVSGSGIPECQDPQNCQQILTPRPRLKPAECQNQQNSSQILQQQGLKMKWKRPSSRHQICKKSMDCLHKSTSSIKRQRKSMFQIHKFVKVLQGSWTHPCRELSFGRRKPGATVNFIGKRPQQQKTPFAGSSLCEANINCLNK